MLSAPADLTVLVVGDHLSHPETHRATEAALRHAADDLGAAVEIIWMATDTITTDTADQLGGVDAMVVPPGPCASTEGVHAAIGVARRNGIPLLATCAGMQHLVIEFARHVVGASEASHAELDATGSDHWITELSCGLAGQSGPVTLEPGTLVRAVYHAEEVDESYYCSYGVNPDRVPDLVEEGLVASGLDPLGEPHIVELAGHPFFVGTLFVPQVRSTPLAPHPLFTGLLAASV